MPTVAKHMSTSLVTASANDRLADAAKTMADRGVGAVIVLEEGRLAGILTERDVLRAVADQATQEATVGERMTRHPETVGSDESTDQAAALMIHGGFRHLPVVDGGEVRGILSIRDLMRVALEDRAPRGV